MLTRKIYFTMVLSNSPPSPSPSVHAAVPLEYYILVLKLKYSCRPGRSIIRG